MKVVYGKPLSIDEKIKIEEIAFQCGILFDTARLLYSRGNDTVQKAKNFLSPGKNKFLSPNLFRDMKLCVDRISEAKLKNQKVLIYGDYDADGISAVAILYYCLKEFGINALVEIPEREDGYGINFDRIMQIHSSSSINLIITVDCGVSEFANIEKFKQQNIDVIVTDHHEPPQTLPKCLILNPKIKDQGYPFEGLCGAGVAYKLGCALIGDKANAFLDFVALATVADSMDLLGENRDLVAEGLKLFNNGKIRPCFMHFLGDKYTSITAQSLAFTIAPRINAGGRMGDSHSVLELFLSNNANQIFDLAVKLNNYNTLRQIECDKIYNQAKEIINQQKLYNDQVIVVASNEWKTGFIGIVAAKLVEDYNRPAIVCANGDGFFKGSARSVDSINIYDAISNCSKHLLGFGGHYQAAGLSVEYDKLNDFRQSICKFVEDVYNEIYQEKTIYAEWLLNKPLSNRFVKELELLEPFGTANKKPVFAVECGALSVSPLKENSPHYSFNTEVVEVLNFNGQDNVELLSSSTKKTITIELNLSTFRNKEYIKGYLKNIIPDYQDFLGYELDVFRNELLNAKESLSNYSLVDSIGEITSGYGTLYCLSDVKNLLQFSNLLLPKFIFDIKGNNNLNCILISPKKLPCGYEKVVYLDAPLSINKDFERANAVFVNKSLSGQNQFKVLSCNRQIFSDVYTYLNSLIGTKFTSSINFAIKNDIKEKKQFVFCFEVFLELGFFYIENNCLYKDQNKKSCLENSKIFTAVKSLKGELC